MNFLMNKKRINIFFLVALIGLSLILPMSTYAEENSTGFNKNQQIAINFLSDSKNQIQLGQMSDAIWSYAELGLEEYNSSALLINYLEHQGFTVQKGVAGIPTAFVATYTNGAGPTIGILGEYDALPGLSQKAGATAQIPITVVDGTNAPGHGCTHNTQGTAAAGAAAAVKKAMVAGKFTGTIKMFGCPAEETSLARAYMVYGGAFDGVDIIIDNVGDSILASSYGVNCSAMFSFKVTFHGKTAHSASGAYKGRSALDAVEIMNTSTEYLREHLKFTSRIHYVITEGGDAPNVVPDRASVWYFVRDKDDMLKSDFEKVIDCAKAAALATGTTMEVTPYSGIHALYENENIANELLANIQKVGYPKWSDSEQKFAITLQKAIGAPEDGLFNNDMLPTEAWGSPDVETGGNGSTDVSEVTLVVPTATVFFPVEVPGCLNHHWSDVASDGTTIAHKGIVVGAKIMAVTAIEYMTNADKLTAATEEFNQMKKTYSYNYDANGKFVSYLPYLFSFGGKYTYDPANGKFFVPEGAKIAPALGLLSSQMNKYRPEMAKNYKTPSWYDGPPMKTK